MGYSFTEKKRVRKSFSKRTGTLQAPSLLAIQKESYHRYLQAEVPREQRIDQGLQAAFKSVFPIESYSHVFANAWRSWMPCSAKAPVERR